MKERFRWLAALVAAHPDGKIVGRTRLQKEVKLLQRLGFPTDYAYTIHFYGPYSEGLHADIGLLESLGLVKEEACASRKGDPYYVLNAQADAAMPEISEFQPVIDKLDKADSVILELAATYDMFRAMGSPHNEALERLRRKKGQKCEQGREATALKLLAELGLPNR